MVGETSDSHPDAAVQYIHTENSYEPLARVDSHGQHAEIFCYHTERPAGQRDRQQRRDRLARRFHRLGPQPA